MRAFEGAAAVVDVLAEPLDDSLVARRLEDSAVFECAARPERGADLVEEEWCLEPPVRLPLSPKQLAERRAEREVALVAMPRDRIDERNRRAAHVRPDVAARLEAQVGELTDLGDGLVVGECGDRERLAGDRLPHRRREQKRRQEEQQLPHPQAAFGRRICRVWRMTWM
jgi:hypothetical protein